MNSTKLRQLEAEVKTITTDLESEGLWARLRRRTAGRASDLLHELYDEIVSLDILRLDDTRKAKREAATIKARITLALAELTKDKKAGTRRDVPHAIVMSPYQFVVFSEERGDWSFSNMLNRTGRTFNDLPIYTADGVFGPLVVTEAGLAGMTRQAPELDLRLK